MWRFDRGRANGSRAGVEVSLRKDLAWDLRHIRVKGMTLQTRKTAYVRSKPTKMVEGLTGDRHRGGTPASAAGAEQCSYALKTLFQLVSVRALAWLWQAVSLS